MGLCYYFYNPNDGKEVASGKFCGINELFDTDYLLTHCAIEFDYATRNIKKWTIDEKDELYKHYFDIYNCNMTYYITREIAEEMKENENLLIDLMNENLCDGLIVDII